MRDRKGVSAQRLHGMLVTRPQLTPQLKDDMPSFASKQCIGCAQAILIVKVFDAMASNLSFSLVDAWTCSRNIYNQICQSAGKNEM